MLGADSTSGPKTTGAAEFTTTHWSVVLAAGQQGSLQADQALAALCQSYWYPLYAFTRKQGYTAPDAQDLVQGFFCRLLARDSLRMADQRRGRFRSFLLASLKHYVANEWDRQQAAKRSGREATVSFDELEAEERYARDSEQNTLAETLFDRQWALSLIERALTRLKAEFAAADKLKAFDRLKHCLVGGGAGSAHAQVAAELGSSEGAVKVMVHRMRSRFRELIRAEIAETVAGPAQVEEEMRYLLAVLCAQDRPICNLLPDFL